MMRVGLQNRCLTNPRTLQYGLLHLWRQQVSGYFRPVRPPIYYAGNCVATPFKHFQVAHKSNDEQWPLQHLKLSQASTLILLDCAVKVNNCLIKYLFYLLINNSFTCVALFLLKLLPSVCTLCVILVLRLANFIAFLLISHSFHS